MLYLLIIKVNYSCVVIILISETIFFIKSIMLSFPIRKIRIILFLKILVNRKRNSLWKNFIGGIIDMEIIIRVPIILEDLPVIESKVSPHPSCVYCMSFFIGYDNFLSRKFISNFWIHKHKSFLFGVRESNEPTSVVWIKIVGFCIIIFCIVDFL